MFFLQSQKIYFELNKNLIFFFAWNIGNFAKNSCWKLQVSQITYLLIFHSKLLFSILFWDRTLKYIPPHLKVILPFHYKTYLVKIFFSNILNCLCFFYIITVLDISIVNLMLDISTFYPLFLGSIMFCFYVDLHVYGSGKLCSDLNSKYTWHYRM